MIMNLTSQNFMVILQGLMMLMMIPMIMIMMAVLSNLIPENLMVIPQDDVVDDYCEHDDDDSRQDGGFDARRFHRDAAGLGPVDDDYFDPYDSDDEQFDVRRFHGDVAGLDHVDDDDYYDSNENKFDVKTFHGNAAGLDDVPDYDDDYDFMVSAKIMKDSVVTAIIQPNTMWVYPVSVI